MSTANNIKFEPLNIPGVTNSGPPPVVTTKIKTGLMPSAVEARAQREDQINVNTTVTAAGHGKGDSVLPSVLLKKSKGTKAEVKDAAPAEKQAADGGQEEAVEQAAVDAKELARLNRLEAKSREKDKQLKEARARMAELEAQGVKAKELESLMDEGKREPVKAISKLLGIPQNEVVEFIANYVIDGKVIAPDPKLEELEKKVQTMEQQKQAEQDAKLRAEQAAAEHANMDTYLRGVNGIIGEAIQTDETAYELTVLRSQQPAQDPRFRNAASEDAMQLVRQAYETYGVVPTHKQVADALEKYYEQEAEAEFSTLAKSKKLAKKLGIGEQKPAKKEKKESPTLSGRKMAAPSLASFNPEGKVFKDKAEKMKAIAAWGDAYRKALAAAKE